MLKQTKIVASISDLRCDVDFTRALFEAGMNVVRMNKTFIGGWGGSSRHEYSRMERKGRGESLYDRTI